MASENNATELKLTAYTVGMEDFNLALRKLDSAMRQVTEAISRLRVELEADRG